MGHLQNIHPLFVHYPIAFLTGAALFYVLAWLTRPLPPRGRALFLFLLLALLGVMTLGADYGARMVYDYNAGGNACSQPIEFVE